MEQAKKPKWEGSVLAKLKGPKPDQVWPLLQDFFNFHKYFPSLPSCKGTEGVNGQPGCVRFCSGFSLSSDESDGKPAATWATEKLIAVDPVGLSITLEVLDSNIGFESYVATLKVLPQDQEDECMIEWKFEVDPIEGWRLEDMVGSYQYMLDRMARRIEEGIVSGF